MATSSCPSTRNRDAPYGQPARIGSRLTIDREQARIVKRIFQDFADGLSPVKIVEALNREGVPPPGIHFRRRSSLKPTWCASALYGNPKYGLGLLNCPTYKGELVWGKSKWTKDPDTKKKRRSLCEEPDWIRTLPRTCASSTISCGNRSSSAKPRCTTPARPSEPPCM